MGYLTKSRFIKAMECPTKLYYEGRREYRNRQLEDSFLEALAEGGFQVGELARCYHPEGIKVDERDTDTAVKKTEELMKKKNITIFEGAFLSNQLLVRVDILEKTGNRLNLIEVKAKSYDGDKDGDFLNQRGNVNSNWSDKINDAAFQKMVLKRIFPQYAVDAYLMLPDKNSICPTEGLHQKFKIQTLENGRKTVVQQQELTEEELDEQILIAVNANKAVDNVLYSYYSFGGEEMPLENFADCLAASMEKGEKIPPVVKMECKACEFQATEDEEAKGLKSGLKECWKEALGWGEEDFQDPAIFEIGNFPKAKTMLAQGIIKMKDLDPGEFEPVPSEDVALTTKQRQALQVKKTLRGDFTSWINRSGLGREMDSWTYPLHLIDFETAMPAIPMHKGMRPYEGIAFQFSHHVLHEDGRVEHRGEYLKDEPGAFPNFEFIRALKKELEEDQGTIFRYAAHENSYLNMIYRQIQRSGENSEDHEEQEEKETLQDREELLRFIKSITKSTKNSPEKWVGERNMVDLLELVKKYYYDPRMKGSNSIKKVLPAVLNQSEYLQEKYKEPIYGSRRGIPSLNFENQIWIQYQEGEVIDPYKLLPPMFQDITDEEQEILDEQIERGGSIADGGAAMAAYARLQFEDMPREEREEIRRALLKYCELDTLAMVMIIEGWREQSNKKEDSGTE